MSNDSDNAGAIVGLTLNPTEPPEPPPLSAITATRRLVALSRFAQHPYKGLAAAVVSQLNRSFTKQITCSGVNVLRGYTIVGLLSYIKIIMKTTNFLLYDYRVSDSRALSCIEPRTQLI